jgi:hypothetical protein
VRRLHGSKLRPSRFAPAVALIAFVAVKLDAMVRVFMLIVAGLYQSYPIPMEALPTIFVLGAIQTPLEAACSVAVATVVGVPVLTGLEKGRMLGWLMSQDLGKSCHRGRLGWRHLR